MSTKPGLSLTHQPPIRSSSIFCSSQIAVEGHVTVFDLTRCCVAVGLLPRPNLPDINDFRDAVERAPQERWGGDVDRFLRSVRGRGVSRSRLEQSVAPIRGAVIGWPLRAGEFVPGVRYELSADLVLTLAVLSRRVGDLFLPRRAPAWTWEGLFGSGFAVADRRFGGHPLSDDSYDGRPGGADS